MMYGFQGPLTTAWSPFSLANIVHQRMDGKQVVSARLVSEVMFYFKLI